MAAVTPSRLPSGTPAVNPGSVQPARTPAPVTTPASTTAPAVPAPAISQGEYYSATSTPPTVSSPSVTAPANAAADQAADQSDQALQSFFSSGPGGGTVSMYDNSSPAAVTATAGQQGTNTGGGT